MQNIKYPAWLGFDQTDGLRNIDIALARLLFAHFPDTNQSVLRLAAITSYQLQFGNPALDLEDFLDKPNLYIPLSWQENGLYEFKYLGLDLKWCVTQLSQAGFVDDGMGSAPLVLSNNKLYLKRFWLAAANIRARVSKLIEQKNDISLAMQDFCIEILKQLFASENLSNAFDWQKMACVSALLSNFLIITGGPGTGKTTTVVKLLTILQAMALNQPEIDGLRIALAAPTGKAAARLSESIGLALGKLNQSSSSSLKIALDKVPTEVQTLHRLLGSSINSRSFKHNKFNLLNTDVLVIDEASMMDIEMFDAVIDALPENAKLILLGDKDQLASVEAGAVLGELCVNAEQGLYTPEHKNLIASLSTEDIPHEYISASGSKLDQSIVMLRKSYRFDQNSGIGKLAEAVNKAKFGVLHELLKQEKYSDLNFFYPQDGSLNWLNSFKKSYLDLFDLINNLSPKQGDSDSSWDDYALEVLEKQSDIQILCAVHKGNWGTANLNQQVEQYLKNNGLIARDNSDWYPGRPVMLLKNRPDLGLANGDIGVALAVPNRATGKKIIRVAFADAKPNKVRWFSPVRLSDVETVFALTVHKSQGSEFNHVVLVLPDLYSPVLTRELLYTGITRARQKLTMVLAGGEEILNFAINSPTKRSKAIWF